MLDLWTNPICFAASPPGPGVPGITDNQATQIQHGQAKKMNITNKDVAPRISAPLKVGQPLSGPIFAPLLTFDAGLSVNERNCYFANRVKLNRIAFSN